MQGNKIIYCILFHQKFVYLMQQFQNYGHIKTICIIGYGSIGKGILPLIKRHFTYESITVIDPISEPPNNDNVKFIKVALVPDNFETILDSILVGSGSFCVNLSVGTSSADIIKYCQKKEVLYIDTVKEEWEGYYSNLQLGVEQRTNYALRHNLLTTVREKQLPTTAISCCGANPGMVSWFVKKALTELAKDLNYVMDTLPSKREEWALLMKNLGVKGIHIAERDTQRCPQTRPVKAFWNTWSVDGFISEAFHQASELGWGTHEKWKPPNAQRHDYGCDATIYLDQPGMNTMVKTWCPTFGPQFGFLVTHDEAISIADYYTVKQDGKVIYRPTSHYAYHPCEDATSSSLQCMGSGVSQSSQNWKILNEEITQGADELGVLLYGHSKNAFWYGSQLDIHRARTLTETQNATGLQVSSAVLAGMVWALENPRKGLVEADEMDFKRCLEVQRIYIEPLNGYYTDWTPLANRTNEFQDDNYDLEDAWQFKNIIFHK